MRPPGDRNRHIVTVSPHTCSLISPPPLGYCSFDQILAPPDPPPNPSPLAARVRWCPGFATWTPPLDRSDPPIPTPHVSAFSPGRSPPAPRRRCRGAVRLRRSGTGPAPACP